MAAGKMENMMKRMGIWLLTGALYLTLPYFITALISGVEEEGQEQELLEARRIRVEYQRGTREMDINQYITGVLLGWGQWLDLENENQEMIKLLAIIIRTDICWHMREQWILEARELSHIYYSSQWFLARRGPQGQKEYELIEDCVLATSGKVLCEDGVCMEIDWYEESEALKPEGKQGISLATAREMTRQGSGYEEVLQHFYKESACLKIP